MIWKTKRIRRKRNASSDVKRRAAMPQQLERRELLAADPIHVGVVYLETDYLESDNDVGEDSRGDRFLLSFEGGAADTELKQLRIRTDKDGDGISVGDPIFDTELGGRGKRGAHDFEIIAIETSDGRTATAQASVVDGGQELVLNLQNFRAGDRLEFTLDVDEVLRNSLDLAVFNDRLDVITSGQEFQDSILEAVFDAPHYETATADAIFLNDYGRPNVEYGLDLPPDDGTGPDSRPNRSAAAVATTAQVPKPVAISGHVWLDNNLDAIWQSGEVGLSDVELALWMADQGGQYSDTGLRASTNSAGYYEFSRSLQLQPGDYQVVQRQPQGLYSVAAIPGTVAGQPTGFAQSMNVLSAIQIPLGDSDAVRMDFAEAEPASIGGFVYQDDNNNGVRETGELGIGGVTVRLVPVDTIASQDSVTAITGPAGEYSFSGVAPGGYEIIEVNQPVDFVDGLDSAGTVDGVVVGQAVNPGDVIRTIRLGGGDVGVEYNFGELAVGEISGYVFLAAPGEDCTATHDPAINQPLGGVIVELQSPDGNVLSRVTTTPMGEYRFDAVTPGRYRIMQFTPAGLLDGSAHVGTIDGVRNGIASDGTLIRQITMNPGGVGVEYNFCEIAPAKISGSVYHDRSNEGRRDANERGIAGASITLVDDGGAVVATTLTDADGRYEFVDLLPGTYELRQSQPAGYLDGIDTVGAIAGVLVGIASNDRIRRIDLPQGMEGQEYNFGELLPASLSGAVHVDLDGDCVRDENEVGLSGVMIRLINEDGVQVAVTQTNAEGIYRFSNLVPGRYSVVQDQPAGYFDGGTMAGSAGGVVGENRVSEIDLESGTAATDYDFCEEPPASLSGSVYVDADQDCVRDAGEVGIEGVTIELRDSDGRVVATTSTDADGDYRFDGLRGGQYTVFEVQPEGYLQGSQRLGSAGGVVLGVDLMSVSLEPGQAAVDYLFCEIESGSISGTVWADQDQDRVQDPGEATISEVTVKLVDEQGVVIRTTKTDVQGRYSFTDLAPGVYGVCEEQPEGYFHGGQLVGDQGGQVTADDVIRSIVIGSGVNARDYSFPEVPPASVSGFVFIDGGPIETEEPIEPEDLRDYRDGVLTSDDTPIAGVRLEIRDEAGEPLGDDAFLAGDAETNSVVTTDADGYYVFDGLRPGTYTIFQSQPDEVTDSLDTPGSTGGLAVNAADSYSDEQREWIESVAGTESLDVILGVAVDAGEDSKRNNFSEVEIQIVLPPDDPPINFLPTPEKIVLEYQEPLPEFFEPKAIPFTRGEVAERVLPRFIGEVDAVTWHLSVINGGYPRGAVQSGSQFKAVAMKRMRENWTEGEQDDGKWKLLTIDGEVREESEKMNLGADDAVALVGDFNGDGHDEIAIFVAGHWYVDLNGNGVWDAGDLWILLGTELDYPVVGDWDGDGKDDIGIFGRKWERDLHRVKLDAGLPDPSNRSRRFLENRKTMGLVSAKLRGQDRSRLLRRGNTGVLRADAVDHVFQFGEDVDTPISGDWNGDGIDQIGTFRAGTWVLDTEGDGRRKTDELTFEFGAPGDQPIVGDFDGDGIDEVGVIRGNVWIIDSDGDRRLTAADQQIEMPAESSDSQPVVGDWDGDGKDEPGFYRKAG